jgi:glycolate oxidase FAD binding subunit
MDAPLMDLQRVCRARAAGDEDAVAGCRPCYVAAPSSTVETSGLMRVAAEHGMRVLARGAGTKLDWGAPADGVDLVVETGGLDRILEHAPGDLVVRVQAGVPLAALQERCATAGQMLALDPVVAGGTVGGTLATNASGPYRMRYGTCRDLLIGVTVVLADGTVASSGGKVVKNVAGYDLGKLYIGSLGTLGLITEAVFRLHPRPTGAAVVSLATADPGEAVAAARRVRQSQLAVAALEVDWPDPAGPLVVAALVESPGDVPARAERVAGLLGGAATVATQAPPWWGEAPWLPGGAAVKLAVPLSRLPAALELMRRHGSGLPVTVRGSLGAGVLYAGLPADVPPSRFVTLVGELRAGLSAVGATAVVLGASFMDTADRWGPVAGVGLMRRIKSQFDPQRRLAAGRFVAGI